MVGEWSESNGKEDSCRISTGQRHCLILRLDGSKSSLCKVQTHPLKSPWSSQSQAPPGSSQGELPPSLPWWDGLSPLSSTLQGGEGAGLPCRVSHWSGGARTLLPAFQQPCLCQQPTVASVVEHHQLQRQERCLLDSVTSPGGSLPTQDILGSPDFPRELCHVQGWESSPQTPTSTLHQHSYANTYGKTMFRLKAALLPLN